MNSDPDKIDPKAKKSQAQMPASTRIAIMVIIILSSIAIGIFTALH